MTTTARNRALVRMFETVNASHCSDGKEGRQEMSDLRPLLLLMDIGR